MNRIQRAILAPTVCLASAFSACSEGAAGLAGNEEDPPSPAAVELRSALADEGITALSSAPTVSDELFELGQALFFDKELSGNRDVSCATCHWPELGSADERTLPGGVDGFGLGEDRVDGAIVPRNSPAVLNTHGLSTIFWDGRVERDGDDLTNPAGTALTASMRDAFDPAWELLAAQAMFPPTSRDEMRGENGENELANLTDTDFAGIWDGLRDRILAMQAYRQMFLAAYPDLAIGDIEFAHAANAIAAFEVRAFTLTDSPFERFVGGDNGALTEAELAGGIEFFGAAGCARCHSGSLFTDGEFHNIGLPQLGPGKGDGTGGVEDFGRERVTGDAADRYDFRTPGLRNIALTAPYGHAGQYATLEAIVRHYTNADRQLRDYDIATHVTDPDLVGTLVSNQRELIDRLDPDVQENRRFDVSSVVTFLNALTADSAANLPDLIPDSVPSGLTVR